MGERTSQAQQAGLQLRAGESVLEARSEVEVVLVGDRALVQLLLLLLGQNRVLLAGPDGDLLLRVGGGRPPDLPAMHLRLEHLVRQRAEEVLEEVEVLARQERAGPVRREVPQDVLPRRLGRVEVTSGSGDARVERLELLSHRTGESRFHGRIVPSDEVGHLLDDDRIVHHAVLVLDVDRRADAGRRQVEAAVDPVATGEEGVAGHDRRLVHAHTGAAEVRWWDEEALREEETEEALAAVSRHVGVGQAERIDWEKKKEQRVGSQVAGSNSVQFGAI